MKQKTPSGHISGYLTVYLSLCMGVMITLTLLLIRGVQIHTGILEAECASDIALNSVFSEYHRELLNRYDLLALDSSYGTLYPEKKNTESRIEEYLSANLSGKERMGALRDLLYRDLLQVKQERVEITKVAILTDRKGKEFRRLAVEAMKDEVGVGFLAQMGQWLEITKSKQLTEQDIEKEKQKVEKKIQAYEGKTVEIQETDNTVRRETLVLDTPTKQVDELRKKPILQLMLEHPEDISRVHISKEETLESRIRQKNVNVGNLEVDTDLWEEFTERIYFQEYLMKYMGRYGDLREGSVLQYQVEYLLMGKPWDEDNLEAVVLLLLAFREASNAAYLATDQTKMSEAEVMAAALSVVVLEPKLKDEFKSDILLAWSIAESIYDVKQLMKGKRIPLIKTSSTWHYSLKGALSGKEEETTVDTGLNYGDYLRIFLSFINVDELTMRAMSLVETDLRTTPGNGNFRLDGCYSRMEVEMSFHGSGGMEYELKGQKAY